MSNRKANTLIEKIESLEDKIAAVHKKTKQSQNFELKMRFTEFIENALVSIDRLSSASESSSPVVTQFAASQYNSLQSTGIEERERINMEREELRRQKYKLDFQEQQLLIDTLKIQMEGKDIARIKAEKQFIQRQKLLKDNIKLLEIKIKDSEKQFQRLFKLNIAQSRQIELLKEERNRAELRQQQIREKYTVQIGSLQKFNDRSSKYTYRNNEGIKCLRIFSNVSGSSMVTNNLKGHQKFIICDIPFKFHVVKLVYGIKLAAILSEKQMNFFDEVLLYEKQNMAVQLEGSCIVVKYIKRNATIRLQKFKGGKLALMLYGRGDSVAIDQTI